MRICLAMKNTTATRTNHDPPIQNRIRRTRCIHRPVYLPRADRHGAYFSVELAVTIALALLAFLIAVIPLEALMEMK